MERAKESVNERKRGEREGAHARERARGWVHSKHVERKRKEG